jgi:hypothetical protein
MTLARATALLLGLLWHRVRVVLGVGGLYPSRRALGG